VNAISGTDAWATGYYQTGRDGGHQARSLILHWNGTHWAQVPSPN
jgi:hypothetical protein